jgi:hypothetical protein
VIFSFGLTLVKFREVVVDGVDSGGVICGFGSVFVFGSRSG